MRVVKLKFGFSLIETMIVVVIGSLLMMAGIASYSRFNDKQMAKQGAMDLASQLRLVQKMAAGAQNSKNCANPYNRMHSYRVNYQDTNTYQTILECKDISNNLQPQVQNTTDLKSGLTFNNFGFIDFTPLGQSTTVKTINVFYGTCRADVVTSSGGTITTSEVTGC